MKDFKNGVGYYTSGKLEIHFPEDDICCMWCPMLREEFSGYYKRHFCKRTGEFIPAPTNMIGLSCPIDFERENEE